MRGSTLVREARRRAGITQAELAARAGTTQSAIARLERGGSSPSLERVTELVRACGFDLDVHLDPVDDTAWDALRRNRARPVDDRLSTARAAGRFVAAGRRAVAATRG